ncbi:MAG TPA: DUF1127 domain-containing protein [Pseudolabrys sp.]|nr:DUF1127 domain-containing protein [Pseudolabrys sp.]
MLDKDEIDFSSVDYSALSWEEKACLRRRAIARAGIERNQALRQGFAAFFRPLRRIGGRIYAAFVAWRKMRRRRREEATAIAELRGLDDLMLKDMGITRGDIVDVVRDGGFIFRGGWP